MTVLLDRPVASERAGGVWDYVSASRLNLWLKCPLAFKLRYIDGIRTPPTPNLFLGKRVHAGLEQWYRHRQLGVGLPIAEVTEYMETSWNEAAQDEGVGFKNSVDEDKLRQQAVRLVKAYLAQVPEDERRPLAVETRLEAPLIDPETGEDLGIPLVGVLDLVLDDVGGSILIDFKTAGTSGTPLEITHEVQLSCYGFLYRALTGTREAGLEIRSLVKTKTPQIATHHYSPRQPHDFRRLFAVIREYLDALDRGVFNYRPAWGCRMCDYCGRHCSSWSGT